MAQPSLTSGLMVGEGDYQLDVQKDGFRQVRVSLTAGPKPNPPLRIVLPISVPNQEIAVQADEAAPEVGTEMAENQNATPWIERRWTGCPSSTRIM